MDIDMVLLRHFSGSGVSVRRDIKLFLVYIKTGRIFGLLLLVLLLPNWVMWILHITVICG